jgi:hypothetical protein
LVVEVLITCWKQLAIANIETINMMLFYISYAIQRRGETFVRSRLDASTHRNYASTTTTTQSSRRRGCTRCCAAVTEKVSAIMRTFSPRISPLISVRMVQFANGVYRVLARGDEPTTARLLRSTFLLDQHGITGVQNMFRWVAHGMVAASKAFRLIETEMTTTLMIPAAKQAFKEILVRLVHFRCFGTGKRFVLDAVNLLLRTAGYSLAQKLLDLLSLSYDAAMKPERKMEKALDLLVEVMSSWHCIVTMTSGESSEEELMQNSAFDAINSFENEILLLANVEEEPSSSSSSSPLHRVLQNIKVFVASSRSERRRRMRRVLVEEARKEKQQLLFATATTPEEACSSHHHSEEEEEEEEGEDDDEAARILHCNEVMMPMLLNNHRRRRTNPSGSPTTTSSSSSEEEEEEEDGDASLSSATALPYMYIRSMHVVPMSMESASTISPTTADEAAAAAAASSSAPSPATAMRRRRRAMNRNAEEEERRNNDQQQRSLMDMARASLQQIGALSMDSALGDPTIARKVDHQASDIWEYCWRRTRHFCVGEEELVNMMQYFKPLLLYSAVLARNIVATNTYYLHEHIARALIEQQVRERDTKTTTASASSSSLAFP